MMSVFHWQNLITYFFSVSLKFQALYITGQWSELTVKNAILHLHINQSGAGTGDKKFSVELCAIVKNR